jgi:hypothetical protein
MTVYEKKGNVPFEVIERGYRCLETHYRTSEELPALWINKALYNPYHIVEAVISSAIFKYQQLTRRSIVSKLFNQANGFGSKQGVQNLFCEQQAKACTP